MLRRLVPFFVLPFFLAAQVEAATLYIDPATKTLGRGDALILKVRIDTDESVNECINAASGVLSLDGPINAVDVSSGESIFSMWVEPPTLNPESNQISFAGGIPNGYCGRIDGDPSLTNTLFEIVVRSDVESGQEEAAVVDFSKDTMVYLNDGFGTVAKTTLLPTTLTILAGASAVVSDPWTDRISADDNDPQAFGIILDKEEKAFSGKYYISFNTTDKETGIDHYEVMEEPLSQTSAFLWGRADAPWIESRSPYVLEDQSLNSVVRVKAIDKAGNEYIANYIPDPELRTITPYQILSYILYLGLFLMAFVFAFTVFKRYKKRRVDKEIESLRTQPEAAAQSFEDPNDRHYDNIQ